MLKITNKLIELKDEKYAKFHAGLIPTIDPDTIIGVRVPEIRKLAVSYEKDEECEEFINSLPHKYYDENLLHAILLCRMKPFERCLEEVDRFLPYADNWAVTDCLRPKSFAKNKKLLFHKVQEWISSDETYICRFGIGILMAYYLDDDFQKEYLELPANIISDEYYVNMMIAWYYATALAKQWDSVIPYIEKRRLPKWVHNKTIQKARESYRISKEQKEYLKSLKM